MTDEPKELAYIISLDKAKLGRDFYLRDCVTVAKDLIGKILVKEYDGGHVSGIIVETEAYAGLTDPASHSFKGNKEGRVKVHYETGGLAYIYLIYGMYNCLNIVCNDAGIPESVLIRALQPLEGVSAMHSRQGSEDERQLCNGPGKLCRSMGIDMNDYGADLCCSSLYLLDAPAPAETEIVCGPRIHIEYSGEEAKNHPWRFTLRDNEYVSGARIKR